MSWQTGATSALGSVVLGATRSILLGLAIAFAVNGPLLLVGVALNAVTDSGLLSTRGVVVFGCIGVAMTTASLWWLSAIEVNTDGE